MTSRTERLAEESDSSAGTEPFASASSHQSLRWSSGRRPSRSPSLTIPTGTPATSSTGTAPMEFSSKIRATSLTCASALAVTTGLVITSFAVRGSGCEFTRRPSLFIDQPKSWTAGAASSLAKALELLSAELDAFATCLIKFWRLRSRGAPSPSATSNRRCVRFPIDHENDGMTLGFHDGVSPGVALAGPMEHRELEAVGHGCESRPISS